MSYEAQQAYVGNRAAIVPVAQEVASKNYVKDDSGNTIIIDPADVSVGVWNFATRKFYPGVNPPNAVNVTVRRDGAANGAVATFLAGVLGIRSVNVSATATAALSSLLKVPPGGIHFPVGISKAWFSDPEVYCKNPIRLYPTNTPEGCAGWNVLTETPANAKTLRDILIEMTNETYTSPETISGATAFNFTGGTVASDFDYMKALFDTMKVKDDGTLDKDTNPETWTTMVPVYDRSDCSNPTPSDGPILIVGFATVTVTSVMTSPEKTIDAHVSCDSIIEGSGGGPVDFGTFGDIPNLVQ